MPLPTHILLRPRPVVALAAIATIGLFGCPKHDPAAPVGDSTEGVLVRIGDHDTLLRYGYVTFSDPSLIVHVTEHDVGSCDRPDRDAGVTLEFALPPGPGARFYDHAPIGVGVSWGAYAGQRSEPTQASIRIAEVQLASRGWTRGALEMDVDRPASARAKALHASAHGSWRAILCETNDYQLAPYRHGLPQETREPLRATIAGVPFAPTAAFVIVGRDFFDPVVHVDRLELVDGDVKSCADRASAPGHSNALVFRSIGGGSSHAPLLGPQPASADWSAAGGGDTPSYSFAPQGAWVHFDALSFEPGAVVTGTAGAASGLREAEERRAEVQGTFRAIVCREDR